MPAGKGTGGVPAERRHEDAAQRRLVHVRGVKREEPGVFDGPHGGYATGLQDALNVRAAARLPYAVGVLCDLIIEIAFDMVEEQKRVGAGELIGDEACEALRPWRVADAFQGNVAVVSRQIAAACRIALVVGAIEVHAARFFYLRLQTLPGKAVGGVAVQVEYGWHGVGPSIECRRSGIALAGPSRAFGLYEKGVPPRYGETGRVNRAAKPWVAKRNDRARA